MFNQLYHTVKNLPKVIFIYASFILLSLIVYSCCTQNYEIIGKGELNAFDLEHNLYQQLDTIKGEFYLSLRPEIEVSTAMNQMSVIQGAYATSCEHIFLNPLDATSLRLTSDTDFLLDNETIEAGTDFSLQEGLEVMVADEYGYGDVQINFLQAFLDRAEFSLEARTFAISIETVDGLAIKNDISLVLDL